MVISIPPSVWTRRRCLGARARKLGWFLTPKEIKPPTELLSLRSRMRIHEIGADNTLRRPHAGMADTAFHRAPAFHAAPTVHSEPLFHPTRAFHPAHYFIWNPLSAIQWELLAQCTLPDAEGILAAVGTDEHDTGNFV